MASAFETCIREQMQRKHFGEAKADAIIRRFNGLSEQYRAAGAADPELQAMTQAFDEFHAKAAMVEGTKLANLTKTLDNRARIQATELDPGLAIRGMISQDPRQPGGSYDVHLKMARDQIHGAGGDVMDKLRKGVLGFQRGKAYLDNVAREIYAKDTGDAVAKQLSTAASKMFDTAVDLLNSAAGAEVVRKVARYLPQKMRASRMIAAGFDKWKQDMMDWLDWGRMFHPDGAPIRPGEREAVLKDVFQTITENGAHDPDVRAAGVGASIRSQFDQHRFLVFRSDNDAWLQMHKNYGDSNANVYDVIVAHINDLAHEIALARQWGTNPEMMYNSMKAFADQEAKVRTRADIAAGRTVRTARTGYLIGRTQVAETKATFELTDAMFRRMTRADPYDPENLLGVGTGIVGNIIHSAYLGMSGLTSVVPDFMTAAAVSKLHGMGAMSHVKAYLDAMVHPVLNRQMARQYLFMFDQLVSSNYSAARFSVINEYAPAWAQRLSDFVLRGVGQSGHTNLMKWSVQKETMGHFARERGKSMDQMSPDYANWMALNGITEADWNTFRALAPDQPHGPDGPEFLAPFLLLRTNLSNKQELFQKFQGAIYKLSASSVPEASIEVASRLNMGLRPQTIQGLMLTSHSTYLSYPMSLMLMTHRNALASQRSTMGKLKWVAGLGIALVGAGALSLQMRELRSGRDLRPMGTTKFFFDSLLASGALSIYGDYIYGTLRDDRSLPETLLGPTVGFGADVARLTAAAAGDSLWLAGVDAYDRDHSKLNEESEKFFRRYAPGTSAPLIGQAMQRAAFDRWAEVADPKIYKKRQARDRRRYEMNGNESWWGEGDRMPTRAPNFSGAFSTGPQ